MEEVSNITKELLVEILAKGFPIEPLRNKLIITVNIDETEDELQLQTNMFSEIQYVVAVGSRVVGVVPGHKIRLNLDSMMEYDTVQDDSGEKRGRIKITPIEVDGRMYALITDGVIDAIDHTIDE